jgi:HSP20 family protein
MSQMMTERPGRLERWSQADELEAGERLRRIFDQTFGGLLGEAAGWVPAVDLEEQDDAYTVEVELPGVKKKDVDVELIGNELMISGEIEERERVGVLRRRTRRYGRFEFRVSLPGQVDAEAIEAKLDDGVLTVHVPKSQREQRRKIRVGS